MGMKHFNIQMAAQISGLSTHTIRAWEKRYQALTPKRSDSGRRQYTGDDIERLTLLSQLTNLGNAIGQIANLEDSELKEILDKMTQGKSQILASIPVAKKEVTIDLEASQKKLLKALQDYQVDVISQELEQAKNALSLKDFALKVFRLFLQEMEQRHQQSEISSAQVSALNAILKFHAGNIIYGHYESGVKTTSKIALGTPEGEDYVFDILIAALLCCHFKIDFFYLSSNLPAGSLVEAANAVEADTIILGVRHLEQLKTPLPEYIEEMGFDSKKRMDLWLVGNSQSAIKNLTAGQVRIFNEYEKLAETLRDFS